jgi:hypothetical protein
VYGALVPATQFGPMNGDRRKGKASGEKARRFISDLCRYPGNPTVIAQAQQHNLTAHAERLTREQAEATERGGGRRGWWMERRQEHTKGGN